MEQPDQLRELFRRQQALNQRIGGNNTGGMSADDVFAAYMKNKVNFKRQETGYAVKDHDDSKHI